MSAKLPHAAFVSDTPAAEIDPDEHTVRDLLLQQCPQMADLPLHSLRSGWDNKLFRLGESLCVRLPRRLAAVSLIEKEQHWLSILASFLPLSIPVPLIHGRPTVAFPWPWSVVTWLPGNGADEETMDPAQAFHLGIFLRALHREGPRNAPTNPMRGVPLARKADQMGQGLHRLQSATDSFDRGVMTIWERGLRARADDEPCWIHGDLHPQNLLVREGKLTAVIDWGDLCVGDRATDLASLWMLFADSSAHDHFFRAYGSVSPDTLSRARAWACFFGVALFETGRLPNSEHLTLGRRILANLGCFE